MFKREFWEKRIQDAWKKAPIIWLTGVRRVGKTTLCQSFPQARFLNCDLHQTVSLLEDPASFFRSVSEPIVIFDEIHQLEDPSRLLKIGADEFPEIKILATGSSTLAATQKFKDSLTGRKRTVELCPVLFRELSNFGVNDLRQRLFRGGLPQALLSPVIDPGFYGEWLDSYFARDVQELFHVEKRSGFLKLLELILRQSGGLLEATHLARASGLSRPTVLNYLQVFELTHSIRLLRPFFGGGKQEIIHQPKVYGFDTGFVRYVKGWGELREEDCGLLWEHLVLDELLSSPESPRVQYWRDKRKREIDFVIPRGNSEVDAIEVKWNPSSWEPAALQAFRELYPKGKNILVSPQITQMYFKRVDNLEMQYAPLSQITG
jgi:predicted AAA+ superfamily ATPase